MAISDWPAELHEKFDIREWRHASAILAADFPDELRDIQEMLARFRLYKDWITEPGKNKSSLAIWVDQELGQRGWIETQFKTQIKVDDDVRDSPTHKVDCYKNKIALELEWNNKDPFYDRDLNNFRLLFDLRVISVGVIFTRSDELQQIFNELGKGKSYGNSTTHTGKLISRIEGGGGGGCPLIVIGIKRSAYDDQSAAPALPKPKKKKRKKAAPALTEVGPA